jgi:hypothetical protein
LSEGSLALTLPACGVACLRRCQPSALVNLVDCPKVRWRFRFLPAGRPAGTQPYFKTVNRKGILY